jgi:hypothetical protein
MAKENLILTESQVQALERKKQDDLAAGEIETAQHGSLQIPVQDTRPYTNDTGLECVTPASFLSISSKEVLHFSSTNSFST